MEAINAVPWQTWTESQSQVYAANNLSVVGELAGKNWDGDGARDEGGEVEAGDGDEQDDVYQGQEANDEGSKANGCEPAQWAAVEVDWELHRNGRDVV